MDDVCLMRPVMHLAMSLLSTGQYMRRSFFQDLLLRPDVFQTQFMPTMAEDEFAAILATQGDVGIYYCMNGHPYLVGNCTRPDQAGRCVCGAPIGNARGADAHTMDSTNKFGGWSQAGAHRMKNKWRATMVNEKGEKKDIKDMKGAGVRQEQEAPKGYALGDHTTERDKTTAARQLTPTSLRILRYFMHGMLALAHAADLDGEASKSCGRLKKGWRSTDFVNHMRNDYHILMDLVKRSTEDVSFMLHLVAQQYLHHLDNAYGKSVGLNPMIRKEDRKSFETFFHSSCVNPVLEGCLQRSQLQTVKSTCDVSSDEQLVFLNAEVTEMDDFDEYTRRSSRISRTPLLLRYRRPITYGVFVSCFELDPKLQRDYPIIRAFLEKESELRLLHNVFDIYQFSGLIFNTFNRRIGRKEAQDKTVGAVLAELKGDATQKEWRSAWQAFVTAWNTLAPCVKRFECNESYRLPRLDGNFDRVMLPRKPIRDDLELPIDLAMPSRVDEGYVNSIATVALLQWSTRLHNSFVEDARTNMVSRLETSGRERTGTEEGTAAVMQQSSPVPTHMLRRSDYINYEFEDFVAFVNSHTSQSLEYGHGGEMSFDWQAIQQWIFDHVVASVPMMADGMRQFEFRGEGMGLANMVGNVPQSPLDAKLLAMILAEQKTPMKMQRLQERLREIMGFLRSTGGQHNTLVGTYASTVLQFGDTELSDMCVRTPAPLSLLCTVRLLRSLAS